VDAFLAGLSDEQARKLLSERLKRDAEALSASAMPDPGSDRKSGIPALFNNAEDAVDTLFQRLGGVFAGAETAPSGWPERRAAPEAPAVRRCSCFCASSSSPFYS
jgi:hypothetical protein